MSIVKPKATSLTLQSYCTQATLNGRRLDDDLEVSPEVEELDVDIVQRQGVFDTEQIAVT